MNRLVDGPKLNKYQNWHPYRYTAQGYNSSAGRAGNVQQQNLAEKKESNPANQARTNHKQKLTG